MKSDLVKVPAPFLRWAGGKRKLAPLILEAIPSNYVGETHAFFEPFVGGGAITFALGDKNGLRFVPGKNLVIADTNPDLILTYTALRDHPKKLMTELDLLKSDLTRDAFENIRATVPKSSIRRAARFIYLNKTCFNGLWRVNSKGEFNVPWGKLKNPLIYSEATLLAASERLRDSEILLNTFSETTRSAKRNDLVYFDPPYLPLTASASFSKYSKNDFLLNDHIELAKTIERLTNKGVYVILSNSDTPESRDIFSSILSLRQVLMSRNISAAGTSRQPVNEIIGVNFPIEKNSRIANLKLLSKLS